MDNRTSNPRAGKKGAPLLAIGLCLLAAAAALGYFVYSATLGGLDPAPAAGQQTEREGQKEVEAPAPPAEPAAPEADTVHGDAHEGGIDQARVRPDGSAVVAGRAPPGSRVDLLKGGAAVGSARADDKGDWVIVPGTPLEPGSHLLHAEITPPGEEKRVGGLALVIEFSGKDDDSLLVALLPYTEEELALGTAPRVLQAPDAGARRAAAADAGPPAVNIRSIQALQQGGRLQVAGDARGGTAVTLGINGATAPAVAVSDGAYAADQGLDPGAGRMRIVVTLMDQGGRAVASAKISLKRSEVEQALGGEGLAVVQKGDALWRIAYRTYGRGLRYVDIYRRNSGNISNPDLIYPDQVFVLPGS